MRYSHIISADERYNSWQEVKYFLNKTIYAMLIIFVDC